MRISAVLNPPFARASRPRRESPLALTYEEAAVSTLTIRRAVRARELRTVQATGADRTRRIRPDDLDALLQRRARSAAGELAKTLERIPSFARCRPSCLVDYL